MLLTRRRPPTRNERLVDLLLGVSRRRRQMAYLAIASGFRMLQPALKRLTMFVFVVLVWRWW
jgi:hypothetical protein